MILNLKLTEEHLKLIRLIRWDREGDDKIVVNKLNPYCLMGTLDDLAFVLGYRDKAIPGTEDDPEGRAYPDDIEKHILDVHHYIVENIEYIESLVHQFVCEGGLTPGKYKATDAELIWTKTED